MKFEAKMRSPVEPEMMKRGGGNELPGIEDFRYGQWTPDADFGFRHIRPKHLLRTAGSHQWQHLYLQSKMN